MGIGTELQILTQSKKAQGETNQRLDRLATLLSQLIAEQQRTNVLIDRLGMVISQQAADPAPSTASG